ncbi:MAG TPA: Wzt carbohydrate-binding domain-containing protein [Candidatus Sulfotelmatobacter sp.]|nr:Wzt carbohydrate-binding domain-containing protein [Candidatus Sulfotelmatobacter sp.]
MAAHLQPEILLLDEVLAVGDLRFQQKCLDHAKRLQAEAATVLFVSHNMFAVKALCSRVLYIADGRIRRDGPTEEVIPLYEADSRLSALEPGRRGGAGAQPGLITAIELLDAAGEPRGVFEHGERMVIRLRYRVRDPIRDANVVVAFIRSDNVACCNHASATDGLRLPVLAGEGSLEVVTPPLKLTAETYAVHVLVWDRAFKSLHCQQYGATFHIRHPLFSTHFGVFHEPAEWRCTAGAALHAGRNGGQP